MGGCCSKKRVDKSNLYAAGRGGNYGSGVAYQPTQVSLNSGGMSPQVRENMEKELPESEDVSEPKKSREPSPNHQKGMPGYANNMDDFYDGIPRYTRARSLKSRSLRSQGAVAKVSEVSTRLGKAGSLGLGKAVEVLDTLSSTVINLNPTGGFASGGGTKGNEMSILAFEVANTIVKASNLMQFLSKRSMRHLKEVVLPSEGVQRLVSTDMDELLRIVVADKREELKIFVGEVVRFGNHCRDPQWHNLDLYFEKHSRGLTFQKRLEEEADTVMQQLMTLVRYTAELYHELGMLDRYEQDYQHKRLEDAISIGPKGGGLAILRSELKNQKKQVRNLKKKSLWSRSLEEVMEKLVDIVHFLHLEIRNTFGTVDSDTPVNGSVSDHQRLGPAGLALHYANIVMQIDALVGKSSNMPPSTRDALYQNLPPSIKSALRSKIQSFHVKEELTITEIKAEMEKTLQWLVPIATNTAKAHHGFGWVGEWAGTGKAAVQTDVIQIATFHHADKEKTEAFILEQILWLQHLASRSQHGTNGVGVRSTIKSPTSSSTHKPNQQPNDKATNAPSPILTEKDQEMLQNMSKKKRASRISKSLDFDSVKTGLRKHNRLSKSGSYSPTRGSKELAPVTRFSSGLPVIDFGIDKKKALDVIDRVDTVR